MTTDQTEETLEEQTETEDEETWEERFAREEREEHAKTIKGMRELLDYLEERPEIPFPYFGNVNVFVDSSVKPADIMRAMGSCTKGSNSNFFYFERKFENVRLHVNFSREDVCERIVTGTEEIAEVTVEAYTRDIVEWVCPDSLFAQENEANESA